MGVDCEYCLIVARLISLLVALVLWLPIWPPVFRALAGLIATRRIPCNGDAGRTRAAARPRLLIQRAS